ncbi:MAG TPA: dihydropteroate synthase [Candidatus Limnocylindrales bacterium]|nr:dihydropteroate synthase [Candidatus Limnocylindrales bacterium]
MTVIGPRTFRWGERTFVMGILNATPDSFSGDGLLSPGPDHVARAIAQARAMADEGADLLDIGGESTRPGHGPVTLEDELARVVPVIEAVRDVVPDVPLTIDTTKPEVAAAALDAGAHAVNDIWGVSPDDALARLAAQRGVPIILMHNRAKAVYDDLVPEVLEDLRRAIGKARAAGVPERDILIDPGIGFGKTAEHNIELLRDLARLRELGHPILLGTSRKSTIGRVLDLPRAEDRLEGTLATTALGVAAGVDIVRVHDVRENVRAARMADAIVRGWRG